MTLITTVNRSAIKVSQSDYDYNAHLKSLVTQLPLTSCEVCVIVPVRNEAENLATTLLALTNQVNLQGKPLAKNRYEIIVLANNCSDDSAEIARRFARTQPVIIHVVEMTLEGDRAYIGWVRKLLMDEAYRRLKSIGRSLGIIASTDGDTKVSPTWIAATIAEINSGVDGVGGRIITERQERLAWDKLTRLYYLRYVGYLNLTARLEVLLDSDPDECYPRHYQHFGASLAVTAQIYAKVGGLPPLHSSEDVALYEALKRVDARFHHSPRVKVTTSARMKGRATAGLSARLSQLKMMAQNRQPVLVESADLIKARFLLRRWLRYLWNEQQAGKTHPAKILAVAQKLDLTSELLEEIILRSPTFGLLVEQIGQYRQDNDTINRSWQKVTIQKAIADLRQMINAFERDRTTPESLDLSLNSLEQIEPILLFPQSL